MPLSVAEKSGLTSRVASIGALVNALIPDAGPVTPPTVPVPTVPKLAAGVLASFPSPTDSTKGIIGGKHVTCTLHPPSGRVYMNGGDFINPKYGNSYQHQTFSLDPVENIAAGGGDAGWRLEEPYDEAAGSVQPWNPDYTGFPWDESRGVFWMVPGLMVVPGINYLSPASALTSVNPATGSLLVAREVMKFNPSLPMPQRWKRTGVRADVPGGTANADQTHDSFLDPAKDVIVRSGINNSGVCFDILDLKAVDAGRGMASWRTIGNPTPTLHGPWQTQIQGEKIAVDRKKRFAYMCDLFGHLCRLSLDDYSFGFVADLPGGPLTSMANYTTLEFDEDNRVLLYSRSQILPDPTAPVNPADGVIHAFHVDDAYACEHIPEKTSDGSQFTHRMSCHLPAINATLFFGGMLDYASLAKARLYYFRYH